MELCSICPKNAWEWMFENNKVMLLTHLTKYPEYVKLAQEKKKENPNIYYILDNSLIELGDALSMESLIEAADLVNANEIILKDVFLDAEGTIKETFKSLSWLKEHNLLGKYKLMAVVQGKNKEEWEACFNIFNCIPEIDVLGIPKNTSSWLDTKCRGELSNIFMKSNKELHFLGSWNNLEEILSVSKDVWNRVRSCDTCLPSLYVIQNKTIFEDREGTIDLDKEYPELTKSKYNELIDIFNKEVINRYGE